MIDEADALYGLPLREFVPARGELAKRLRADGRRDDAAVVAKLPKPTVAAWAANQVLRSQRADARELLAAGDVLASARGPELRDAITRHRDVLGRLLAAANGLLDENGRSLSTSTLERVQQTLNAASLDPDLREEAEAARLTKEQLYSGLGLGAPEPRAVKVGSQPPRTAQRRRGGAAGAEEKARAREEQAREEKEAERTRRAAETERRKALRAAERRLAAAGEAVEEAERRLEELREVEEQARAEVDALREAP